jgi:hypothetical protein
MFWAIAMPETRARVGNKLRIETRKDRVIALVDNTPHQDREEEGERNALDADRVEIGECEQSRA